MSVFGMGGPLYPAPMPLIRFRTLPPTIAHIIVGNNGAQKAIKSPILVPFALKRGLLKGAAHCYITSSEPSVFLIFPLKMVHASGK